MQAIMCHAKLLQTVKHKKDRKQLLKERKKEKEEEANKRASIQTGKCELPLTLEWLLPSRSEKQHKDMIGQVEQSLQSRHTYAQKRPPQGSSHTKSHSNGHKKQTVALLHALCLDCINT